MVGLELMVRQIERELLVQLVAVPIQEESGKAIAWVDIWEPRIKV